MKVNYIIQSILMLLAILLGIAVLFKRDNLVLLLYYQFLVGVIQYLTSLIFLARKKTRIQLVIIHFALSTVFLILLFSEVEWLSHVFEIIPWGLAVLFWYASRRLYWLRKQKPQGT